MNIRTLVIVAFTAFMAGASPAWGQSASVAGAFSKGRTHFVASGGTGSAFGESYFVLGVGARYYLMDGLDVGLSIESWSGNDPGMYKITPSVQYVFYQLPQLNPYVGAFLRRTSVEDLADLNSVGARAGVYLQASRNAFIGIGAVYESYFDCRASMYRSCSGTYPEVSFTLAF